jgi:hypothetical protein
MMKHFLIEFFETRPQFLILLPDLDLVQFGVVGQFGHVLVALRVGELGVGNGR